MTTKRPLWAETSELMLNYYDTKWGFPEHDDRELFKMLTLELFQSGLSWSTIWKREAAFEKAFANFDAAKVAVFDQDDFKRLMNDSTIIRNRRKIMATINNAKVIQELLADGETLNNYVWSFVNFKSQRLQLNGKRLPSQTSESKKMVRKMKADGFQFVGPTTAYSFMTAVGMVNARED